MNTPPTTLEAPKKMQRRSKFFRLLFLTLLLLGLGYGVWHFVSQPKSNQSANAAESKVVPVVRAARENLQTEKDRRTETETRDRLLTARRPVHAHEFSGADPLGEPVVGGLHQNHQRIEALVDLGRDLGCRSHFG